MAIKKTAKKIPKRKTKKVVKKRPAKKIQLELLEEFDPTKSELYATNELLKGVYCNIASFKFTNREFVLDFVFSIENHSVLTSRVITSPAHAKAICEALGTSIKKYEKAFGVIEKT